MNIVEQKILKITQFTVLNCIILILFLSLLLFFPSTGFTAESFTSGPTNAPDPFNWGPGGIPSATTINLQTTSATDLRIEIYNKPPDSTVLRRRFYSDKLSATTLSTTWLGTDDRGTELTNGTYTGKFKLRMDLSLQLTIQGNGVVLDNPSDVAIDSTGNIYIVNKGNRTVQKFNSGGILLLFDFQSACASNQPHGIAVDSSGNIYIANTFWGTIEKYSSTGILVSSNWATGMNSPTGMASDASNIYIADEGDDVIYKVSINSGGAVTTAASPAGGNNGFVDPQDVDVDSSGNFYIVGVNPQGKFDLFKHNSAGTYQAKTDVEPSVSAPGFLSGVTVDSINNIYVTFTGNEGPPLKNSYIKKYTTTLANGTPFQYGSFGSGNNQFKNPLGLGAFYSSASSSTYIYVSDSGNSRIQKIQDDGSTYTYISSIVEDINNVISPHDMAVDPSGNIYVVCQHANTIKVFNSAGVYQYNIGSYGNTTGYLNTPYGVTVDSAGKVYISDLGNQAKRGQVQIFTNGVYESTLIAGINNKYTRGLGIDTNDNVYTAWSDGDVYRNGNLLVSTAGSADDVCVDYTNNFYVGSSSDNRIYVYDSGGNALGNFATGNTPQVGITVDWFGDIFLSTSSGIERYNHSLSTRLGNYLGSVLNSPQGVVFSPDYQYIWVADKENDYIKKYKLEWDDTHQDSMTIQITNQAPTVNNVVVSGSKVQELDGEYYASHGNATFTISFSENMNTFSNLSVKYLVNSHEYYVTRTSFVGNTWIGTCSVISNDDGTATINIRDGYDTSNNLMDPHPNIDFDFVIDTIPPAAPTVNQPGSPTSEITIQVNGSAEANIFVHVYDHSQSSGGTNISYQSNVVVDGDNNWTANSIALLTSNPPHTNWIWAMAVDKAGNASAPSSPRKKVLYVDPSAGSGYITPSTNVYLGKTYGVPWSLFYTVNSYMSNGTLTIDIPFGWAVPTTNSTDPGYSYIKSITSMSLETVNPLVCSNHLIKLSFENAVPGAQVEISYGNSSELAVSNYAVIGINTFEMRAENNDPDHDWYP
ncbi:MAG: hypothetical protein KKH98_08040, partial [Spirochaetes bacterium]|nr:hypothetical protein [Spirochaetota bacterium]